MGVKVVFIFVFCDIFIFVGIGWIWVCMGMMLIFLLGWIMVFFGCCCSIIWGFRLFIVFIVMLVICGWICGIIWGLEIIWGLFWIVILFVIVFGVKVICWGIKFMFWLIRLVLIIVVMNWGVFVKLEFGVRIVIVVGCGVNGMVVVIVGWGVIFIIVEIDVLLFVFSIGDEEIFGWMVVIVWFWIGVDWFGVLLVMMFCLGLVLEIGIVVLILLWWDLGIVVDVSWFFSDFIIVLIFFLFIFFLNRFFRKEDVIWLLFYRCSGLKSKIVLWDRIFVVMV